MILVLMGIICLNIILPPIMKLFGYRVNKKVCFCGLTGYCGSVPTDPTIIKMIMIYNQSRGEDSTGWSIGGKITKDTNKVSEFITKVPFVLPDSLDNTIIAHARKASSGAKHNKELAHPFGIHNELGNSDAAYDLILAMNGTLTNTQLLSEKFSIEYKNNINSDTQVLSKIMAKLGPEEFISALELYDGTATLLFYMPNDPSSLFIYKDPQRELFAWKKSASELYISSMKEPLIAVGAGEKEVLDFDANKLYFVKEGDVKTEKVISRNPLKPVVVFAKSKNYNYHEHYSSDYYDACAHSNQVGFMKHASKEVKLLRHKYELPESHNNKSGRIYTINERYWRNGHALEGLNYITNSGKLKTSNEATKDKTAKPYFFINGYMCKSEEDYNKVYDRCLNASKSFDKKEFSRIRLSEIVDHFEYPVLTVSDGVERWLLNDQYEKHTTTEGDKVIFTPFLSDEEFVLTRLNRWTSTTRKVLAETYSVSKAENLFSELEILESITSKESEEQTIEFLLEKLKKENFDSPNYYYCEAKRDLWKVNASQKLKQYFYTLILKIALEKKIINETRFNEIVSLATNDLFSGTKLNDQMEKIIISLRNILKEENSVVTVDNIDTCNTNISTPEKVKLYNTCPNYTEEDIIQSIKISNELYNRKGFPEALYNVEEKTLDEHIINWVTTQNEKNLYEFYEAVLLTFHVSQRISDSEMLYVFENQGKDMISKAEEIYNDWYKYVNDDPNEGEPVEETLEDNSQSIRTDEEITPEYYYTEFQMEVNEQIKAMKEILSRMDALQTKDRNLKLEKLQQKVLENVEYMEKHMFSKK